jgi:L-fucose isomerase-like protein
VDIIKAEGYKVIPARTNSVSARINAVDDYLMRQVDGDPAFLLDPRCTQLKAAMMGGYRYKPKGDGDIDKNKHSHVAEALQYLMLHLGNAGDAALQHQRREIKKVASSGWT